MNLYKRNNVWWVSFTLNKHQYRLSTQQNTRVSATEVANALYNRYKDVVINKKVSFKQIVDKFLELSYLSNQSISTKQSYKTHITYALEFFKNKDFFNKATLYEYAEYLTTKKNLKSNSVRKHFNSLRKMAGECQKIGFIAINPLSKENLDLSNYKKNYNRERYLLKEDFKLIQEYCINNNKQDLLDYIEFAIATGLRKLEQLNLTWDNIKLIENNNYGILKYFSTKVEKHIETILSPMAVTILKNRLEKHKNKPFPIKTSTLRDQWIKLVEDLQLNKDAVREEDKLVWHSLRHSFITWLQKGWFDWQTEAVSDLHTQLWVGHSDLKTTRIYTHNNLEDLLKYIK